MLISTRNALGLLQAANPEANVTEDRIRSALRRGVVDPPSEVAGRFLWTAAEVDALAKRLGLDPPEWDDEVSGSDPGNDPADAHRPRSCRARGGRR